MHGDLGFVIAAGLTTPNHQSCTDWLMYNMTSEHHTSSEVYTICNALGNWICWSNRCKCTQPT